MSLVSAQAYDAGGGGWRPSRLEKFQGNTVFQVKGKLLKNPEYKVYSIQSKISGQTLFFR